MKKLMNFTGWLVMAATLIAGMSACSKEINTIEEPSPTTEAPKTYTLTVAATKGGDEPTTRALALGGSNGKTLYATWTAGDKVAVYKGSGDVAISLGTLTATSVSADGFTCTLTGELTGKPNESDVLTLKYELGSYLTQKGTLEFIAEKCDVAIATVKVVTVVDDKITTTAATFENQQAIVKFSLKRPDGTAFAATNLNVKFGLKTYKVRLDAPMSDIFVAIPGGSDIVSLQASDNTDAYFYEKIGVTFTNGKYYSIGVKMNCGNVDLSAATGDVTLKNGDIAYGTLAGNYIVSIKAGNEVTLNGVTIAGSNDEAYNWAGIECKGSATINLAGTNTVRSYGNGYPGIWIPSGETLTIQGDGALNVSSNKYGAGIGGGCVLNPDPETPDTPINCGNIVIKGGTITAQGGDYSAGIGSGWASSCGKITISGGTITATGGTWSAGIGTGQSGTCDGIKISGGIVTASGMKRSAGIGSGDGGSCGTITIGSGLTSLTATMGFPAEAPIGSGKGGGTVTIDGLSTWTAGTETTNYIWTVSTVKDLKDNDVTRWTLTHK